jgi:hypothetical protein
MGLAGMGSDAAAQAVPVRGKAEIRDQAKTDLFMTQLTLLHTGTYRCTKIQQLIQNTNLFSLKQYDPAAAIE